MFIFFHFSFFFFFFFFNHTATTEIYTLSLHDALPIYEAMLSGSVTASAYSCPVTIEYPSKMPLPKAFDVRSEEHTSELQSRVDLVCRLLLEKKKKKKKNNKTTQDMKRYTHI